ncbi:DUF6894 family protein [Methylobacterium nigriterrae]|uniref:DUF6894 family protein n=1 Tax=Methylobacterium nigriterrae TaxID=3127512 RepID=UPI0030138420
MARYFFDLNDGELAVSDDHGTECASPKDVSSEALKALCQIAGEYPMRYVDQGLRVTARDDEDRSVLTASLKLTAAWHAEEEHHAA